MTDNMHKFDMAGAHRYQALAAAIIPTASGDGRIIARLMVRTNDPGARHIVMDLAPEALAGVISTALTLENACRTGEINTIAAQLDVATAVDDVHRPPDTH